jgi:hypothetical protein
MSSSNKSSCLGSVFLLVIVLIAIRFALPGLWNVIAAIFSTALFAGVAIVILALAVLGYFTYKNLKGNQKKENIQSVQVDRTEALYKSVISKLQQDMMLNQVSAEEFLQSELLIGETLKSVRLDLARLNDFVSPQNERLIAQQIRDYKHKLAVSTDDAAKQVIQENLKMLDEKKQRMALATEELRQKEASVDLVYNCLIRVEDDLKFGRPVTQIFPADLYTRFGLTPPAEQPRIPPLVQKSSQDS